MCSDATWASDDPNFSSGDERDRENESVRSRWDVPVALEMSSVSGNRPLVELGDERETDRSSSPPHRRSLDSHPPPFVRITTAMLSSRPVLKVGPQSLSSTLSHTDKRWPHAHRTRSRPRSSPPACPSPGYLVLPPNQPTPSSSPELNTTSTCASSKPPTSSTGGWQVSKRSSAGPKVRRTRIPMRCSTRHLY